MRGRTRKGTAGGGSVVPSDAQRSLDEAIRRSSIACSQIRQCG